MELSDPNARHQLAVRMAELARDTAAPRSLAHVLNDVTNTAVALIPAADVAGVLLIKGGGDFESVADTDSLAAELDKLQHDFNEGPCHDAALKQTIVRTDDLRNEPRWPNYAPAAVERGVLSSLSFKLYTAERTAGALNLFSHKANVWDTEAETIGTIFAAHAASAIMASRHGQQMQSALSTRDRIGQAKGIIMERYNVDELRAFDLLRQLSQESQVKLADIAQRVIDTRRED
ncbi:histidine kinase [Mycobacterium sp. 852002-53434_SCH5985345]|uniref:GAF and ANTAR domain-containing protein n=1 Tax=unclassified Mycobacterium TaxID=2642494 RepID=UPI0008011664|nr:MULTISPECIES: GAF and ANTAR domain-containing protein [unclassified Mycobacterium]OBF58593.1 histidine kinase [Mycobacterium sp. 852002-53434_SCH5985345]OBF75462.1 histidine kinase [Mycobacterium sp. 852002-51613_SCH5001154]OBF93939.1 histidine kinase [Mycobacterium sp. 852014-52450_SCH5900713]